MIAFDFEYYKPTSIEEAVNIFQAHHAENKEIFYYGGGTEFISRARVAEIQADVVIDLKDIPECNLFKEDGKKVIIGASTTLTAIAESSLFPLLANVSRLIATHTGRNKITIGGNISSHLPYKEALLPLLLTDSEMIIAGKDGTRKVSIHDVYQNGWQLKTGEFIVQIILADKFSSYNHVNSRKTKHSKVSYPIVSLATLEVDQEIRVAFSGVCAFPFRLQSIETILNDTSQSIETRIQHVMNDLPAPMLDDLHASADYRKFVLENNLTRILANREVS